MDIFWHPIPLKPLQYSKAMSYFEVTMSEELKQLISNQELPFQGLRTLRRNGAAKVAAQRALANRFGGWVGRRWLRERWLRSDVLGVLGCPRKLVHG